MTATVTQYDRVPSWMIRQDSRVTSILVAIEDLPSIGDLRVQAVITGVIRAKHGEHFEAIATLIDEVRGQLNERQDLIDGNLDARGEYYDVAQAIDGLGDGAVQSVTAFLARVAA